MTNLGKMTTCYARRVDHWEPWQAEYRYGVLLIFPPASVKTKVNALRSRYDPRSHEYGDAHINLTVPLPRPVSDTQWMELERILRGFQAFEIRYGPLKDNLPKAGVCLAIEPFDHLDYLRAALEGSSAFDGARPRESGFAPRMTIAAFVTVGRTTELMTKLADVVPTGAFRCDRVSYAVPDGSFHFAERKALLLGAPR